MDVFGTGSSAYSEYFGKLNDPSASKLESSLKTDYAKAKDDELMDVCKQFESYFLEQVFKEMQKTVTLDGDSSSNNHLVDYFKDQTVQQIAADSTELNGLGLAQMLYEQMKRNYGSDEAPAE